MTTTTPPLLDAALAYAARGWYVMPLYDVTQGHCSCGNPKCTKPGKHPHIDDWTHTASIDPAQIQHWWQQWPDANLGLLTGERSHLAVLDVDPRNGGDLALEDLEHSYRPLPDTPMALSGGKGPHHYFALDGPLGKFDPGPGLNLQADGALVVAPPSLHHSGSTYEWEASSGPDDVPLAPLPDWLRVLGEAKASAPVEGVDLPATLPSVDIQTLKVSHRIKYLIHMGHDPDDPQRYRSRSEALFAVLQALLAGGHDDATLASVVMDKRYGISDKVLSLKNARNPLYWEQTKTWVAKEIARAKAKHHARPTPDMTASATAAAHYGSNGYAKPQPDPGEPQTPEETPPSWDAALLRNKSGTPQQTINNFILSIQHLEPWHSAGCWYDVVREQHMIGAERVQDGDDTAAGALIERATTIRVTNLALMGRALDYVCRQTTRDVLQEWVATLSEVPVSDVLTTWLRTYAHVPDAVPDAYVADVSRIIPVSIIARILRPGCQYRYVPILEGPENAGKSKLTKALAGHDPYGRSWHVALSAGLEGKEVHMMLDGALIAELEELSSYTKTDENRMKALITAETDSFVPKFSNKRVDHPRRTVFIATVNPEGDGAYLKGQSGNTRFLPLAVRDINITGFLAIRMQLFAEAKAYYLAHQDNWWQLACEEDASNEREERRQTSVYEGEGFQHWLARRQPKECTWQEVAEFHLQIPKDRWNKALQMEIGKALRAHGWQAQRTKARRYWVPG